MSYQINIDFDHGRENNTQSENHYADNLKRFNGQCKDVLEALLRGERLTTMKDQVKYKIGDLRARIRDLRKQNIPVQDDFVRDETGKRTRYKVYFLTSQELKIVK